MRLLLALALCAVATPPAWAQWSPQGTQVALRPGILLSPSCCSDGTGGAFVAWQSADPGFEGLYVQHLDASGRPWSGWPVGGRWLAGALMDLGFVGPVADGRGGALLAVWRSPAFGGTVDGLHITADGDTSRTPLGPGESGYVWSLVMAPTADGGAVAVWTEPANPVDMRAAAMDASGHPAAGWPAAGVAFGATANFPNPRAVVPDPVGGVYVLFELLVGGGVDLHLSRVDAAGTAAAWPDTGIVVRRGVGQVPANARATLVRSQDGVIATWWDNSNFAVDGADVFVQRYDSTGAVARGWPANARDVCGNADDQSNPIAVSDGADGAYLVWLDNLAGTSTLFAGHVLDSGAIDPAWGLAGNGVCMLQSWDQVAIAQSAGGFVAAWEDGRTPDVSVYAQRLLADGLAGQGWTMNGVSACTASGWHVTPAITPTEDGGTIVVWQDGRLAAQNQIGIFAAKLTAGGAIASGAPRTPLAVAAPWPNPTHAGLTFKLDLVSASRARVEVLDASGRVVATLVDGALLPAGGSTLVWDGRTSKGAAARSGLYFLHVRANGGETMRRIALVR